MLSTMNLTRTVITKQPIYDSSRKMSNHFHKRFKIRNFDNSGMLRSSSFGLNHPHHLNMKKIGSKKYPGSSSSSRFYNAGEIQSAFGQIERNVMQRMNESNRVSVYFMYVLCMYVLCIL